MPRKTSFLLSLVTKVPSMLRMSTREQFGAICYRERRDGAVEVLVITSLESGRWIIPKGWPMGDKEPHKVAQLEAYQEAGIVGKAKRKPLGYFHYLKRLEDGTKTPYIVQVHALKVDSVLDRYPERANEHWSG